jgi:hypothetical protein
MAQVVRFWDYPIGRPSLFTSSQKRSTFPEALFAIIWSRSSRGDEFDVEYGPWSNEHAPRGNVARILRATRIRIVSISSDAIILQWPDHSSQAVRSDTSLTY